MSDPTKPTFKILDWAALVKRAWGPEFSEPDVAYKFGERTFKSSDGNQGGIYEPAGD